MVIMIIKKLAISVILASTVFSTVVAAADGTLNFTGKITSTACNIDASSTSKGDIALGTVASSAFTAAGDVAAPTRFTIVLTQCPEELKKASVRFDGKPSSDSRILALTSGNGVATNVGVGIYEADSTTLIGLQNNSAEQNLTAETNTLTYIAKYYALDKTVGAGAANASATYTVTYN